MTFIQPPPMSPKTLASFLYSPFYHHHPLSGINFGNLSFGPKKPLFVLGKSTDSRTLDDANLKTQGIPVSVSKSKGNVSDAANGVSLEPSQANSDPALVLLADKKKKRKNEMNSTRVSKIPSVLYCCYGCGAPLQVSDAEVPGYVDSDTFNLKKKHRQLRTVLCGRCRLLSHGHMITAVGGNGGYMGGKQFVSAEELRQKLSHLCYENVLIVKLVDIVDFNGSFLAHVRDLAGSNPIILVVTKVDLLPKGSDLNCIGDWVVEATTKKKLNVMSVHLTSSKSLVGITGVVSEIQREKKGRDVYIMGSANVGKSAFINAILKMMSRKDPIAAAARKYKPLQSAVPGTTLGPIQINAFLGGGKLFDTPGVHLHHRQAAVVHSDDLPGLAPQSWIRARTFPVVAPGNKDENNGSPGLNGQSIFWGGLLRIDVIKVLPQTSITFYGPKTIKIHMVSTDEADEFYQKELGLLLTPPTGKQRANEWAGLEIVRHLRIKLDNLNRPACDVAISGLGWFAVQPVGKSQKASEDLAVEESCEELQFAVHVPKPVEIFVRPPMPVGKRGGEWYEYRDLTEKEEEARPRWFF